ncbi:molybdopterin-binding protein [Aeromicrobium sp. A1-2]|uniref:molybdopterin-dependent oxidoreductase n=1 Tax=Aeromicrobium sp. A1-2 TaxID=2107713 RepID=UPI000E5339AB|nr:molybdopterin-dependent oxidoreductase [Aeromicrobium sp. A1-2]AXT86615.1 molybdopterin-binding protein [Aeromicrobium sp. A1-2]
MRLPTVADIEQRLPKPEDFESRARGTELSARVGRLLGIAFGICFLTGMWSHFQYTTPGWVPLGPNPTQLYRFTQGTHILSGIAAIPLLLVKLWSVFPRLFSLPPKKLDRHLVIDLVEKASIGVLVASSFFMLFSGLLNIAQWYPWNFSFRRTHEAVAWIAIGSLIVHIAVKLPVIREALGAPIDHRDHDLDPDAPTRRSVLQGAVAASGLAVLLTAGQTVPLLRKVSVFAVRDGQGPQDLPVNRTAKGAGAATEAVDPQFVLEIVVGDQTLSLNRDQLLAMPQRTHRLPIACVEGWSRNAEWTGVSLRDVIALLDAPPRSAVKIRSMQTKGAFGTSLLPAAYVEDHRTLLALELNGETLSLDHGYPCRIIAPNRPGVFQTKWVKRLEVQA